MSVFKRLVDLARSEIESMLDTYENSKKDSSSFHEKKYDNRQRDSANEAAHTKPTLEDEYLANLELSRGASFAEIKKSYRRLMKEYHPDRHHESEEKRRVAEQVTQKLNDAYDYFRKKNL